MSERDTHFAGFAKLHFPEINKLFFTMYARIEEHRPIEEIDAIEDEIRTLIAQRAYDLACHVASFMTVPEVQRMCAGMLSPGQAIQHISDLTEWPEGESQ